MSMNEYLTLQFLGNLMSTEKNKDAQCFDTYPKI